MISCESKLFYKNVDVIIILKIKSWQKNIDAIVTERISFDFLKESRNAFALLNYNLQTVPH